MDLITEKERYNEAVKELYPEGSFWDEQFADKESDLSLLAEAQAETLYNIKIELNKLWLEARLDTCTESTIADYERIYTGKVQPNLSLSERKAALKSVSSTSLRNDWDYIKNHIKEKYNIEILSVDEKIKPAFFPETRCGQDRIYDYRNFSLIIVSIPESPEANQETMNEIEKDINDLVMANQFVYLKIIKNN